MDTYEDILSAIEEHEHLKRAVLDMIERERSLNLVRLDWKNVLQNSLTYQEFSAENSSEIYGAKRVYAHSEIQRVFGTSPFKVTVLGRFRIVKNTPSQKVKDSTGTSLLCMGACEPLNEILNVMTSDLDSSLERNTYHKFFFEVCNSTVCFNCKDAISTMLEKGMKIPTCHNDSCITKCKVYDGRKVSNTFRSLIEVSGDLYGAVTLLINGRNFYTNQEGKMNVKISGVVKRMIFFKADVLEQNETWNFGDSSELEASKQVVEVKGMDGVFGSQTNQQQEIQGTHPFPKRAIPVAKKQRPPPHLESVEEVASDLNGTMLFDEEVMIEAIPTECKKQKRIDKNFVMTEEKVNI